MGKRAHGHGSVFEYRPGYWLIKYTDRDGIRRSKAGFRSRKAAELALAAIITDIDRGEYFDERRGRSLFSSVALEHISQAELKPRSRKNNESHLRNALSSFMQIPIGDISVHRVDRWWSTQRHQPVNRRNAYFLLKAIMNSALRWGYIKASPCIIQSAGKDVSKKRPTWSMDQYQSVLEHVPQAHKPAIIVMFSGHLRIGELVGLNASDFESSTGRISVTKQGNGEETKTGQHKRILLLPPGPVVMTDYLSANPRIGSAPLFVGPKGGRLPQRTLRAAWVAACEAAGFENFHLHDLRHIGLTEVARAVKNPKDIQARAGHASGTSTNRYLHTDDDRDAEVVNLVSARLNRSLS